MSTISPYFPFAGSLATAQGNTRRIMDMRSQFDDLQRQLASQKRSDTYGGLGDARVSALSFHAQSGEIDGFKSVSSLASVRLKLFDTTTNELRSSAEAARKAMISGRGSSSWADVTAAKTTVQTQFDLMVAALNRQDNGLYMFSGRTRDAQPVVDSNVLINGDGTNAGLRQVVDERRQADLGTGNGRMVSTLAGATATLAEDAAGNPFGIKLATGAVTGALTNLTVNGPAGAPASVDFTFTGQPLEGERIALNVTLPDGTSRVLGFAVGRAGNSDDTVFSPGTTPDEAATNLKAAIDARLTSLGQGELREASAMAAARQFFAGSNGTAVQRVAGPPFATATAYAAAGARSTVTWYKGDDDTAVAARDTQKAQIDNGVSINFGARANEPAIRDTLLGMSLILMEDFPANVASTRDRFEAAAGRALTIMNDTGGPSALLTMNADFGRTAAQVKDTQSRMDDRKSFLDGLLSEIEDIKTEEVALKITSLQTSLQASYTTTAKLAQLSLVNYL